MANVADTKTFRWNHGERISHTFHANGNLSDRAFRREGRHLSRRLVLLRAPIRWESCRLIRQRKAFLQLVSIISRSAFPAYFAAQYNNTYQVIDNFSKVLGTHTLKFGGSYHYDQITEHDFGANNGTFAFTGVETGSDFADFLIGAPASYQQGVQAPLHTRTYYVGLYAQDSWRATSELTLNYGLRWEVTSPWYEAQGQLETIVPGLHSRVFPGAPTGWVFPGDPGIPNSLAPVRHNNFAPGCRPGIFAKLEERISQQVDRRAGKDKYPGVVWHLLHGV